MLNLEFTGPRQSLSVFQRLSCHPRRVIGASWLSCLSGQEGIWVRLGFGFQTLWSCQRSKGKQLDSIITGSPCPPACELGTWDPKHLSSTYRKIFLLLKATNVLSIYFLLTLCICVCAHMCACVYVCMRVHVCVRVHMCLVGYMYVYAWRPWDSLTGADSSSGLWHKLVHFSSHFAGTSP